MYPLQKDATWAKARLSEMISLFNDSRDDRDRERDRGEGQGRSRGVTPLTSPSKRQQSGRTSGGSQGRHAQERGPASQGRAEGAWQGHSAGGSSYDDSVYEPDHEEKKGDGDEHDETAADEVDDERSGNYDGSDDDDRSNSDKVTYKPSSSLPPSQILHR